MTTLARRGASRAAARQARGRRVRRRARDRPERAARGAGRPPARQRDRRRRPRARRRPRRRLRRRRRGALPRRRARDDRSRVEHEDHAKSHGRAVGANMAGADTPYDHLPFFYSDLFDLGYEAVGETDSRLETVAEWAEPNRKGVVAYLDAGAPPARLPALGRLGEGRRGDSAHPGRRAARPADAPRAPLVSERAPALDPRRRPAGRARRRLQPRARTATRRATSSTSGRSSRRSSTRPRKGRATSCAACSQQRRREGYPVKVALIETKQDLGQYPQLFGKPQRYADLLASELRSTGSCARR